MNKVLLITNKSDVTTDFIVLKLKSANVSFYRFNTEEVGNTVFVTLDFQTQRFFLVDSVQNQRFDLLEFTAVYYRRPEVELHSKGLSSAEEHFIKSEILYALEGIYRVLQNARWLNNVYDIRNAENKLYQIQLASSLGFKLPNSIISNCRSELLNFFETNLSDCIIKPIKSGLVHLDNEEEGVVFTSKIDVSDLIQEKITSCPAYVQKLVSKKGDVRVTVVDNQIFAAFIYSQENEETKIDWRRGELPLRHVSISLPDEIQNKCASLLAKLNLNFGAIDFIVDDEGNFIFLEINPNGQWAWIERQLRYPISDTIVNFLIKSE